MELIPVKGGQMPTLVAFPTIMPAPGVLVINDVFGRGTFYEHLTRRLAQAGFVAADPEFFFRSGPIDPKSREQAAARSKSLNFTTILDDLSVALAWLRGRKDVQGGVNTIGFCLGGTLVLFLAARGLEIDASISYYGFPADEKPDQPPLAFATQMRGPILGHWGERDADVGIDNVRKFDYELSRAGVDHDFQVYPGVGHGFLKAYLDAEGGTGYEQACASWRLTLDLLRRKSARVVTAS